MRVSLNPAQRQTEMPPVIPRELLSSDGPQVVVGAVPDKPEIAQPVKPSPSSLFGPRGACLTSADGSLVICDTGHHRVLGWRRRPSSDNAPADWVIGQPDFFSEGRNAKGEVSASSLNVPTGITRCGEGIAVADAWNHRVLIWRQIPEKSNTPADVVIGQPDFLAGAGQGMTEPTASSLFWCYGVHWDGDHLWVADTGNRRVLMWLGIPQRNGQPADLVLGQSGFATRNENGGGEPNASSMRWPHAVALWGKRLAISDAGNNRVMVWDRPPVTDDAPCDYIIGQDRFDRVDHNRGHYWPDERGFNMPYGITASEEWLIAADTANSRLLGWDLADLETGAGARRLTGQPDFESKGDNRWRAPVRDSLCWPYGVMACQDTVVVSDSGNNRVALWPLQAEVRP